MGAKTVIQYKMNIYLKSSFYKKYYTRELRIFLYLIIHSGYHTSYIIKYCWSEQQVFYSY